MMSSPESRPGAELAALDSHGVGVRIRFYWTGDRYGHQIDAIDGLLSRTLLESVEDDQDADWPPSPPLQQVSVSWIASDTEHGHVAMLVGTSGKMRWSMCVSARDCRSYERGRKIETELYFDVACRTECAPEVLGNTYRAVAGSVAISDQLNCAFVPSDGPGCVVIPKDAEFEVTEKRSPAPILRCKATETRYDALPATLRWHYAIRRSSGGPLRLDSK